MSTDKKAQNDECLRRLDEYLEKTPPEQLFDELEVRHPDGLSLESLFHQSET